MAIHAFFMGDGFILAAFVKGDRARLVKCAHASFCNVKLDFIWFGLARGLARLGLLFCKNVCAFALRF